MIKVNGYSKIGFGRNFWSRPEVNLKEITESSKNLGMDINFKNLVFGVVDKFHEMSDALENGKKIEGYDFKDNSKFVNGSKNLLSISKTADDGTIYGIRRLNDNYYNNSFGMEIFFQKPEKAQGLWNVPKKNLLTNDVLNETKFKLWCFDKYNSNIYKRNFYDFANSLQNSNLKNADFKDAISLAKRYLPKF